MSIKNFGFLSLPAAILALSLSACLSDDETADYTDWLNKNTEYINQAEAASVNGVKVYEKVVPAWDQSSFVLMDWHNDRSLTASRLSPLDNSTINVKYLLTNVEGDTIDSSYSLTTYGDSIFQCKPCEMVTGFWIATTSMHVGDSVTAVMPFTCGYGVSGSGSVLPYSTLIFQIKLDSIVAFETSPERL